MDEPGLYDYVMINGDLKKAEKEFIGFVLQQTIEYDQDRCAWIEHGFCYVQCCYQEVTTQMGRISNPTINSRFVKRSTNFCSREIILKTHA